MTSLQEFKDLCLQHGIEQSKVEAFFTTVEKNLKDKRYGLVWEEQMESVAEELKKKFPVLKEVSEREIRLDKDGKTNVLIEGDNLESLTFLKNSGQKVDVIYIDPPYNTGNKDFVYNDRFVDKEDSWRHSSWLSFMNKRLQLARELLTEDGVIFISIDDNEQAQLKLLCDSIFGETNNLSTFIWEKTQHTGKQKINSYSNVEYVLCYGKNILENSRIKNLLVAKTQTEFEDAPLLNKSNNTKTITFPKGSVYFKENITYEGTTNTSYELLDVVEVEPSNVQLPSYPYTNKNEFRLKFKSRWSQKEVTDQYKNKGTVFLVKTKSFAIRALYNDELKGEATLAPWQMIKTVGENASVTKKGDKVGTTSTGSRELSNIIGSNEIFNYPKPISLIKYLIGLYHPSKDSYVLDFFAGSGTTGHAVLELNQEDGGNRQFILCTNNENNIAEEVTYERLKRVMNGYTTPKVKDVEGIPSNLKYFKVENIDTDKDIISLEDEIVENIVPFVQFKENLWNTSVDTENNLVYLDNLVTIYTSNYEPPTEEALNSLIVGEKLYIHEGWVDYLDRDIIRKYQIVPIPKEFFNFKTSEVIV